MVIVPDRHGSGTNALLLEPPQVMPPSFGAGSFARHAALARAAGAEVKVSELPSLSLDVDTPADLAALRSRAGRAPRHGRPHARRAAPPGRHGVTRLEAEALPGLPEVRPGDDLAALLAAAGELRPTDVLAVAHKVVSKAEGRLVDARRRRARRRGASGWPPSTARTRATSRSSSTSPPRSCAPTAAA